MRVIQSYWLVIFRTTNSSRVLARERWQTFVNSWKKTQYLMNTLYMRKLWIERQVAGKTNGPALRALSRGSWWLCWRRGTWPVSSACPHGLDIRILEECFHSINFFTASVSFFTHTFATYGPHNIRGDVKKSCTFGWCPPQSAPPPRVVVKVPLFCGKIFFCLESPAVEK